MVFVTGARSAWNEDHIISRLPPKLQERVVEHVHRDAILMIPILKAKPPSFVAAILRNLRPRQYSQVKARLGCSCSCRSVRSIQSSATLRLLA